MCKCNLNLLLEFFKVIKYIDVGQKKKDNRAMLGYPHCFFFYLNATEIYLWNFKMPQQRAIMINCCNYNQL